MRLSNVGAFNHTELRTVTTASVRRSWVQIQQLAGWGTFCVEFACSSFTNVFLFASYSNDVHMLIYALSLHCRYQSLNLTHVPEHSAAIYEFRWPSSVSPLFLLDKDLKVKQRSADATGKEEDTSGGWEFGLGSSTDFYVFSISGWRAEDECTGYKGQMNVWMETLAWKKVQLCSLVGACKVRTSSKDWERVVKCAPFFISVNVWL